VSMKLSHYLSFGRTGVGTQDSHLLGKHSTTWATSRPCFALAVFQVESQVVAQDKSLTWTSYLRLLCSWDDTTSRLLVEVGSC
jgi:hypothetical protein